jgi:hypothetical protein
MEAPMRSVTLIVAPFFAAGTLAAQAPASSPQPADPVPTARTVWFDAGALLDHQIRAGFEALAMGRYTVGVSVTYDDRAHPRGDVYPLPYGYPQIAYEYPQTYLGIRDPIPCGDPRYLALCAYSQYYPYAGDGPRYRAWSFNVAGRYYPPFFSFRNGPSRMMVYAGGFLGFHWRVSQETQTYYYNPLVDTVPIPLALQDSVVVPPDTTTPGILYPPPPWTSEIRRTISGLQPGVEIGVRLLPVGGFFVEVGGRFNLVTIDDPMRRSRLGDVESRLVIAGGFAW